MEILKKFFRCYFTVSEDIQDLDRIIQDFKGHPSQLQFIIELHQIIQTKSYKLASKIIDKYGDRTPNLSQTEQLIKYIYNKLIDQPAYLNMKDFVNDYKIVFCPVCCPDPEIVTTYSLIQKATVIKNNQQIYVCKPCKLVWLTEDIRADNAQDYKKFMKTLGLKGLWKELENVDLL
jgi:hypothetical protein